METATELVLSRVEAGTGLPGAPSPSDQEGDLMHGRDPSRAAVEAEALLTTDNLVKLMSCAFAFFLAGVNDGSIGALIPYMLRFYAIGTGSVTATYAAAFAGWLLVAVIGGYVSGRIGIGGALVVGAASQLLAQLARIWASSFGVFAMTFFFVALGLAFQDSLANTFVSSVKSAHRWLGLIHACYGFGCLIGPLVATAIASARPAHWQHFYYFLTSLGTLNLVLVSWSFRREITFRRSQSSVAALSARQSVDKVLNEMKATAKERATWTLSLFFFFHLGVAITAGGWLVEYLVRVRRGNLSGVGYVPTGFYGGLALGRLVLVEPTHRLGERSMLLVYSFLCLALQVVFWQVRSVIADAIVVSLMGFVLGPYFAAGISVGTKLLPQNIHTPALSLIFVVGQAGGTLFPIITGVIAARAGVSVLQPILIGLIIAMGASWVMVPKAGRRDD